MLFPASVILMSSSRGLTFTLFCEEVTTDWGSANTR